MSEEVNDMNHAEDKIPASLDGHLRNLMGEIELKRFRQQLPEEFLSDATEGLHQFKDAKQLESVLKKLNGQMHRQLGHKKLQKQKRKISDISWTYWAIVIILLLCITGYLIVQMLMHKA